MADLATTVKNDLADYYVMIQKQLHTWVDRLSAEEIWKRPYPYGNSVGHLLLHLTGNLNYYIGARVAETGYVRERDREFNEAAHKPKEQVIEAFDRTIALVVQTIRKQSPEDWLKPYSAEREPEAKERFAAFLRCAGHAYHHVGQIIYLSRELTNLQHPASTASGV